MKVPIYQCQLVRSAETAYDARYRMNSTAAAIRLCEQLLEPILYNAPQEQFLVITLDTKTKPTGVHPITQGTLDCSLVHPREVFRVAFLANASTIILAHNHPSGDLEPSVQDLEVTKRLAQAGRLLGIEVHDHIIMAVNDKKQFRGLSLREHDSSPWTSL